MLSIDTGASRALLTKLIDDTQAELNRHQATPPAFPVAAAGQGFSAHGAALARVYAEMHHTLGERIAHTLQVTQAARAEIARVSSEDRQFADTLGGTF
ncbi:hypothetical protein QVA66_05760 [Staphylococcus chromogenes]|nr:hypothetical protein [Staphylococcus chromogenes]